MGWLLKRKCVFINPTNRPPNRLTTDLVSDTRGAQAMVREERRRRCNRVTRVQAQLGATRVEAQLREKRRRRYDGSAGTGARIDRRCRLGGWLVGLANGSKKVAWQWKEHIAGFRNTLREAAYMTIRYSAINVRSIASYACLWASVETRRAWVHSSHRRVLIRGDVCSRNKTKTVV